MAATTTSAVYIQVIEDVINKVREEFNAGPGDDVLKELQGVISLLFFSFFFFVRILCSLIRFTLLFFLGFLLIGDFRFV